MNFKTSYWIHIEPKIVITKGIKIDSIGEKWKGILYTKENRNIDNIIKSHAKKMAPAIKMPLLFWL